MNAVSRDTSCVCHSPRPRLIDLCGRFATRRGRPEGRGGDVSAETFQRILNEMGMDIRVVTAAEEGRFANGKPGF